MPEVPSRNQALGVREFKALMDPLGPYEIAPVLAVATSGGADSTALCMLANRWARTRRGKIIALVVDHRLRKGSHAEARKVKARLEQKLGITARVLRGSNAGSRSNIQANARATRYQLMGNWCVRHGIFHLLLAHHLEDQAETFLLRLVRGSGVEGLAGMAPLSELRGVRILRPVLTISKLRLRAILKDAQQPWLEDPSNVDRKFSRVRIRQLSRSFEEEGLSDIRIAKTAAHLGRARNALDNSQADLLARALTLDAAGYAILNPGLFEKAPRETSIRALARVLVCISGHDYSPRFARLERLHAAIIGGLDRSRTLHGCRVVAHGGEMLVCREAAAVRHVLPLECGQEMIWDQRFRVSLVSPVCDSGFYVAKLGRGGLRQVMKEGYIHHSSLPLSVCVSLPALWRGQRVLAVPYLRDIRTRLHSLEQFNVTFMPLRPMMSRMFTLA